MNQVFVIQNTAGLFLTRQREWAEAGETSNLFRTPHHDLALNELFEATAKSCALRATVVKVAASSRGLPLVADLPLPAIPGATGTQRAARIEDDEEPTDAALDEHDPGT